MAQSNTEECPICIEKFTLTTRKEVVCPHCNYKACVKCVKQHLLNQQNPNCMSCHIEFNREFIDLNMTKNFRTKELKQHRENILLDREKALLPATIVYAEQEKERRKMENDCLDMEAQIRALQAQIENIKLNITERRGQYFRLIRGDRASTSSEKQERKQFVKPCVVENCRGFLSTQYKCGICETWVCPDCHEIKNGQKDENHKCNPDIVESVKLIAKETKPCPQCGVVISKISGCSQIWCVECHATFDWNTGRQTFTTNIHNPHYYEWVRRNNNGVVPRNPLDIPHNACADGVLPHVYNITSKYADDTRMRRITRLMRCLSHMRDYNILRFNQQNDVEVANRDLRIKYLLNELTDDAWKKQLQQREKKRDFSIAKNQVCEMLINVSAQYLTEMANSRLHISRVIEIEKDLEKIVDYYNESMKNVLARFNSNAYRDIFINKEKWDFEY